MTRENLIQYSGSESTPNKEKTLPNMTHFLIADFLDPSLKDAIPLMEHPFFSLKKRTDKEIRVYESKGVRIEVKPGYEGMATIYDQEILIFCLSQLMEARNKGQNVAKTVHFRVHQFLKQSGRRTGGIEYERFERAMDRLKGTVIKTNIEVKGHRENSGFGIIDSWRIVEKDRNTERMVSVSITLSEWLYRHALAQSVLTLHPDFFTLKRPLEKRLYEIARKHCGQQKNGWRFSLEELLKRSGSITALRYFRNEVKKISEKGLLDYQVSLDKDDVVTFTWVNCPPKSSNKKEPEQMEFTFFSEEDSFAESESFKRLGGMTDKANFKPSGQFFGTALPSFPDQDSLPISDKAFENARIHARKQGLDIYALKQEFVDYLQKYPEKMPRNVNGAFVNFCKNFSKNQR